MVGRWGRDRVGGILFGTKRTELFPSLVTPTGVVGEEIYMVGVTPDTLTGGGLPSVRP